MGRDDASEKKRKGKEICMPSFNQKKKKPEQRIRTERKQRSQKDKREDRLRTSAFLAILLLPFS